MGMAIGYFLFVLFCIVLAILAFLLPWFVYRIYVRVNQLFEASRRFQVFEAWYKAMYEEQAKTNYYLNLMMQGNNSSDPSNTSEGT